MNPFRTYEELRSESLSGRELETALLVRAACGLKKCVELWPERHSKESQEKLDEALRFNQKLWTLLQVELGNPQCAGNHPDARGTDVVGGCGFERVLVRVERIAVAPFGVEQIAKLQLDFRRLGRRSGVGTKNQTGSGHGGCRHRYDSDHHQREPACRSHCTLVTARGAASASSKVNDAQ